MKRQRSLLMAGLLLATGCMPAAGQLSKVRVGFCARTISAGTAPFAVAMKMGWFADAGIDVNLVLLAGSSDCVKSVTTREIPFALAAVEPQAAAVEQGVKLKTFYTAYQGNIYQLAVTADSPIHNIRDLKGKTIGVVSLGAGVLFAKGPALAWTRRRMCNLQLWARVPRRRQWYATSKWTRSANSIPSM
jgi:NitT/TauT family transport system substrate-binding protein